MIFSAKKQKNRSVRTKINGKIAGKIFLLPVFLLFFLLFWQINTASATGTWQYQGIAFYVYENKFGETIMVP